LLKNNKICNNHILQNHWKRNRAHFAVMTRLSTLETIYPSTGSGYIGTWRRCKRSSILLSKTPETLGRRWCVCNDDICVTQGN